MASLEIVKGSDGSGPAAVATVQNTRTIGSTTLDVDTVAGINVGGFAGAMGTPHTFTDPITSEEITVISEATTVEFTGHVDGANLEIDDIAPGFSDLGSAVGDIVMIRPTTQYSDNLAELLGQTLEDDGKLKPDAAINSPQATIDNITPVGSVLDFAGATAPTGWLLCYGQTLNASSSPQYQDLFDVIGNTYGGTNNTNFKVPDLRGRVVAGQDDMGGTSANRLTNPGSTTGGIDGDVLGGTGGAETHQLTTAQLASHSHTLTGYATASSGGGHTSARGDSPSTLTSSADVGTTGSDAAHNNVQPTLILNKIIKY